MDISALYKCFTECGKVTTDSRNCPEGSMFIALKGETFNGNAYALQALEKGCQYAVVDEKITVAPGLGIGVVRENALFGEMIELYSHAHFLNDDGTPCLKNIVQITTEQLQKYGLRNTPEIQECCGFTIYPKDYFCPIDYDTRELVITENTRTIHHYAESWVPRSARFKNALRRIFGKRFITFLVNAKKKIRNA